jgi:transposase
LLPIEFLAAPAGSRIDHSILEVGSLTIFLETTAPTAACPLCGSESQHVHSRYHRRIDDLPCFGRAVRLAVTVRRFFCSHPHCPRRIFAERLLGFVQPHGRTTGRLREAHDAIGYVLGGEAGARLSIQMFMKTSPDTLLRRVKRLKSDPKTSSRFVGIDDWAWRKGHRYGTIVVDLERSNVIDLLPDRNAETVKAWLKKHPEVELISRDRWSAYSQASSEAAPQAQQVVDRWHLLKNLREAVERLFERQAAVVVASLKTPEIPAEPPSGPTPVENVEGASVVESSVLQTPSEPISESPRLHSQRMRRRRRVERFEKVHEQRKQGLAIRQIARDLDMSRNAVRRYLRCETCPGWNPGRPRRSRLDAHREWIDTRLSQGNTNAVELHKQLAYVGFRGSYGSVQRYVTKRLGAAGKKRERINAAKSPIVAPPSAKQLSFEWVRRSEKRKPDEQTRLDAICAGSDELASALEVADEFAKLIRKQSPGTLSDWLVRGEASPSTEVRRFAEGVRRDESAVHAAVTGKWSNGPVEGHVNRLKTIKRQMYGRAGFVLLRARVIKAA